MPSDTRRICGPADETRAPLDEKKIKENKAKQVNRSFIESNSKLNNLPLDHFSLRSSGCYKWEKTRW